MKVKLIKNQNACLSSTVPLTQWAGRTKTTRQTRLSVSIGTSTSAPPGLIGSALHQGKLSFLKGYTFLLIQIFRMFASLVFVVWFNVTWEILSGFLSLFLFIESQMKFGDWVCVCCLKWTVSNWRKIVFSLFIYFLEKGRKIGFWIVQFGNLKKWGFCC